MLAQGKTFEEVARIRDRQLASVTTLVADLIEQGRLEFDPAWILESKRSQIEHACANFGLDRLRPIKDVLPEEITYDEIRLVVAQLRFQNKLRLKSPDECNSFVSAAVYHGCVNLPLNPPVLPMLAKRVAELPEGDDWVFEPKWDGFRALVFRDGDEIFIQSRDEKPLNRYFPELLDPIASAVPARCVLDGEIVIVKNNELDFDLLQLRLHPAASRVKLLSQQTPASIVFFDLLCLGDRDHSSDPFETRRRELEALISAAAPPIHLTPATRDRDVAADWFRRFEGAGLDGVIAKPVSGTYEPNKRVMFKVKHERDCDCVVAGFRWHKKGDRTLVGSLLLGLFSHAGSLQHVGVCASFSNAKRLELAEFLKPYRNDALATHPWKGWADPESASGRMPGGQSRWSQGKDLSWEPLRPELVVEVAYDHMQGDRFRHTAQFRRWRFDKKPNDCTYSQLEVVPPQEIAAIFPAGR